MLKPNKIYLCCAKCLISIKPKPYYLCRISFWSPQLRLCTFVPKRGSFNKLTCHHRAVVFSCVGYAGKQCNINLSYNTKMNNYENCYGGCFKGNDLRIRGRCIFKKVSFSIISGDDWCYAVKWKRKIKFTAPNDSWITLKRGR